MNKYSVKLSTDARTQIDEIRDYIRSDLNNPQAAHKFIEDTYDAVDRLSFYPYAHPVVEGSSLIDGYDKHRFNYRSHFCLFYVIYEDSKEVVIIRVSYSYRDLGEEYKRLYLRIP